MAVNPYEAILRKLNRAKVNYVLIGVSGINYYLTEVGDMFSTQDCDVLIKPDPKNLLLALNALETEGYKLEANSEPLGTVDLWLAKRIIERSSVITARKKGLQIDIVINAGKIAYKDWIKTKRNFHVGNTEIPVGGLLQLIRSKENSNREKDRIFLKLYEVKLKELLKENKK